MGATPDDRAPAAALSASLLQVNINTMCELGSGGVSLTSMARRTLGVGGMRAAAATYLFLHYALLVACASLHGWQARARLRKCVMRMDLVVLFIRQPVDVESQTEEFDSVNLASCAVVQRASSCCRLEKKQILPFCRACQAFGMLSCRVTFRRVQASDTRERSAKLERRAVSIEWDVLAVQTRPRRAP